MKLNEVLNESEIENHLADVHAEKSYLDNLDDSIHQIKNLHASFHCEENKLISLEGGPSEYVSKDYWCYENKLTSLKGAPKKVGGHFKCYKNKLTTLEGCPKDVGGVFDCSNNQLISLEYCPRKIGYDAIFSDNKITSLVGISKRIDSIGGTLALSRNNVEEGGIGLIFIKDLKQLIYDLGQGFREDFFLALMIINKYLGKGKSGLLECAEELEEAGLGRYAKL